MEIGRMARLPGRMLAAALLAAAWMSASSAQAYTFRLLHSFCQEWQCWDGTNPRDRLAMDADGNLYGTADGGPSGIVFAMLHEPGAKKLRYKVLYHFCNLANCKDGVEPAGPLVVDQGGSLYGTASVGRHNAGLVFRLSPNADRSKWTWSALYVFCSKDSSCPDGNDPSGPLSYAGQQAGLPYDGQSPLYGLTDQGGRNFGGVAYSLMPKPTGKWSERVLYSFCAAGPPGCADGLEPWFGTTLDAAGNLYGTTFAGGANSWGIVFKLSPNSQTRKWDETVLHSFCSMANCADGWTTLSGVTIDGAGNLYGASWRGGTANAFCGSDACGLIYEVAPDGTETTPYIFCQQANCTDGRAPLDQGGLVLDQAGNLYGTTGEGGINDNGTVFRLSGTTLETLYTFCPASGCTDGFAPRAGMIMDSAGNLFGVTQYGGANGGGTLFELVP